MRDARGVDDAVRDLGDLGRLVVLLSSEPFPFAARHAHEVRARLPDARVSLVDGEACSWHGVRIARGVHTLAAEVPRWLS